MSINNHNNNNVNLVNKTSHLLQSLSSDSLFSDFILVYRLLGWCLLPLKEDLKEPYVKFKHLYKTGVTDSFVRKWFKYKGFRNVGVLCGAVSGNLYIVDCDHKSIANKFMKHAPKTLTTTTREGRKHFIYKTLFPQDTRHFKYLDGPTQTEMGVDLVGNKCIVVLPPTKSPKGHTYRILRYMKPTTISIDTINNWLEYCVSSLNLKKLTIKKVREDTHTNTGRHKVKRSVSTRRVGGS